MAYQFVFERLEVWHDTRVMTKLVYKVSEKLPASEMYSLRNQMRRATISVGSNIAEGSGRISHKDQAHFYQLSYSSLMELLHQLTTAYDIDYISKEDFDLLRPHIEKISNKLTALRNYHLKAHDKIKPH